MVLFFVVVVVDGSSKLLRYCKLSGTCRDIEEEHLPRNANFKVIPN